MSVRKLTASMLTALAVLAGAATVHAQPHGPAHVPPADPFAFDPDFRWFEPIYDMDLADMKPRNRANTGWFATYDRLNLYGSRPELEDPQAAETLLDSGWGHRYELGYMLPDKDSGWAFTWIDNNVGEFFTVQRESLMRYNGDQVEGGSGGGFPTAPPFGEIVPEEEQNTPGFNNRFYFIQDTQNVMSFDSYELNKTWRLEPYHYGGILEPMVGVRWMRLKDTNAFQTYQSSFSNPPLIVPGITNAVERVTTNTAITENEMVSAQLGFRYFKYRDRFLYRGEFKVFAGGNWQSSLSQRAEETFIYADEAGSVEIGAPLDAIFLDKTDPVYSRNDEFFVGFDVRGEVGYQLTKMIAVRAGFQLIDIARGVWRGGDGTLVFAGDNDQDVLLVGGTFGLELNR